MAVQNRVITPGTGSAARVDRALRELDDHQFADAVVKELRRRGAYSGVAAQIDRALRAGRIALGDPISDPVRVPGRAAPGDRTRDPLRGPASAAAMSRRATISRATRSVVLQLPHVCSTEAGDILTRRGVLPASAPTDSLRTFAREGRLIALRGDRRWVYPVFQLAHFDPRRPDNIVAVVNRLLDAGHHPDLAAAWWATPSHGLVGRRSPMDLLGEDHAALRDLAAAYAAGSPE
ncbi:MAG: hypothetical protein ACI39C_15535 [Dietzia sp.]